MVRVHSVSGEAVLTWQSGRGSRAGSLPSGPSRDLFTQPHGVPPLQHGCGDMSVPSVAP